MNVLVVTLPGNATLRGWSCITLVKYFHPSKSKSGFLLEFSKSKLNSLTVSYPSSYASNIDATMAAASFPGHMSALYSNKKH